MIYLIILGLVACCLLALLVVAYLVRTLAQALQSQTETRARATKGTTPDVQPAVVRETDVASADADEPKIVSGAQATKENDDSPEEDDSSRVAPVHDAPAGDVSETDAPGEVAGMSPGLSSFPIDVPIDVPAGGLSAGDGKAESIFTVAQSMEEFFNQSTHPKDLLTHENFARGLQFLQGTDYTPDDLLSFAGGSNTVVACIALEALARRTDGADAVKQLLRSINTIYWWPRYYALRALDAHIKRPLVGELLAQLEGSWSEPILANFLREFIGMRAASEPVPFSFGAHLEGLDALQLSTLGNLLEELGDALPESLQAEFKRWKEQRVDLDFLRSFGRVWEPKDAHAGEHVVMLDAFDESVGQLETALRKSPPRSVMLAGERGTGKTTLVRMLAARLQREGWTIFEASAADVIAGQIYIGQIEGRVQSLMRQIGGKRVLWFIPNFQELVWAGRHENNPTSVLDQLLPRIESGEIRVVGETSNVAYEKLLQLKPQIRNALETCRVHPLPDAETLALARAWSAHVSAADSPARISEQTLQEAFQLAKQYLGERAAPGNLLQFLDSTHRRLTTEQGRVAGEITLEDLLVTLSQLTGLPVQMLDEREGINLAELRAFFEQRVLGQPEAVECLTERVAMIKAGLTDPTRPQGVFLFVGPTGTGKTEIAKTLAEFLFGSPDRMIRLDMSEFQSPDSLDRILGESRETGDSEALVNAIRKQPFSVVLLDEFEKANPNVWDLFLQVFDDGRLTDRRGNTADFRHCVVIMTSNLGATLPSGVGIGFSQEQGGFASASVERAVTRAFRREFINRIDRVVVFRPLGRNVMRELLRKELNDVLRRRGLRTRAWAVEWDESAIEFLLQRGFTPDLGARPLKRAIERYLLAPLSMTIVNHQFPEGDQFLFVRSHDTERLDVAFIDPDAPVVSGEKERDAPAPSSAVESEELRLEAMMLEARGTLAEVEFLQEKFRRLAAQVDADEWQQRKSHALAQTVEPDFWNSPARFSVLGVAEYMDRIEAGLDTAGSLLNRLTGSHARDRRTHFPSNLVGRLAEQLYLLDAASRGLAAGEPRDAFIQLRANCDAGTDAAVCNAFAARLAAMYKAWAKQRRMHLDVLEETGGSVEAGARVGTNASGAHAERSGAGTAASATTEPYRMLLAVSGFAAYSILKTENGLHVLETPQDEKSFNRARVLVRVAAQPDEPAGHGPDALRAQAARVLDADHNSNNAAQTTIVRRYREEPSPLVRDGVRQWRTGKLERVLAGDFDIMY
jgi:ATP-dependent Clp protease ATP-binding subunit ClpC